MKLKPILFYIPVLALTVACGNEAKQEATPEHAAEESKQPACTYSYNEGTTQVQWVAYKYTEKTGVKGTFTDVQVTGVREANDPAGVIGNASFDIATHSVNSGDATRDPKIIEFFFGKMAAGDHITGKVTRVDGNETSGTVTFNVSMNGIEKPVEGTYTVTDGKMEVKADLSVSDWGGDAAIASLNEACKDLHKGPDGSSKLWPDVTVFISTTLNKTCE